MWKEKRRCIRRALADVDATALRIQKILLSNTYVNITKLKEAIGHADRKQYQAKRTRSIQALT